MTKHAMIDIETGGTRVNSVVLQIGAVIFNPDTGEVIERFLADINAQSCIWVGAEYDEDTVNWWAEQGGFKPVNKPISIVEALEALSRLLGKHKPKAVWAKGTDFDIAILTWYYRALGEPIPWAYYAVRDLRALLKVAKDKGFEWGGEKADHNALNDCYLQVRQYCAAMSYFSTNKKSWLDKFKRFTFTGV